MAKLMAFIKRHPVAIYFALVFAISVTLVTYYLVLGAALWVVVAVVGVTNRRHLSQQPLRRQMA